MIFKLIWFRFFRPFFRPGPPTYTTTQSYLERLPKIYAKLFLENVEVTSGQLFHIILLLTPGVH